LGQRNPSVDHTVDPSSNIPIAIRNYHGEFCDLSKSLSENFKVGIQPAVKTRKILLPSSSIYKVKLMADMYRPRAYAPRTLSPAPTIPTKPISIKTKG